MKIFFFHLCFCISMKIQQKVVNFWNIRPGNKDLTNKFLNDSADSLWLKKLKRAVLKTVLVFAGCSELYLISTTEDVKHYSKMPIDVMFGEKKNMWSKSNKIVVDLDMTLCSIIRVKSSPSCWSGQNKDICPSIKKSKLLQDFWTKNGKFWPKWFTTTRATLVRGCLRSVYSLFSDLRLLA